MTSQWVFSLHQSSAMTFPVNKLFQRLSPRFQKIHLRGWQLDTPFQIGARITETTKSISLIWIQIIYRVASRPRRRKLEQPLGLLLHCQTLHCSGSAACSFFFFFFSIYVFKISDPFVNIMCLKFLRRYKSLYSELSEFHILFERFYITLTLKYRIFEI